MKAGTRLQRLGHEAAVVVAPHHHGAVVALGVGGHGHDRAPVADGLKFGPGLSVVIAAGHAGGGQAAEHQETLAAFHRIVDAVQGGDLAAGGPVFRCRQPVAPRHPAIGGPFEDDAALAVALGIHAQNSLAIFEQAGGGVPEVLASFPVHHNRRSASKAKSIRGILGAAGGVIWSKIVASSMGPPLVLSVE